MTQPEVEESHRRAVVRGIGRTALQIANLPAAPSGGVELAGRGVAHVSRLRRPGHAQGGAGAPIHAGARADFAGLPAQRIRAPAAHARGRTTIPRWVLASLTIALLVAATALRLWKVGEWPPNGIGFEEFQLAARAPMADWARNFLFLYSQPGEHTLTVYALSLVFTYLGTGFLEMRLAFIIVSLLCPVLLYAVCRKLLSWEVSLFAVALFAVSWWQIAAGRVADEIFFPGSSPKRVCRFGSS